MKTTFIVGGLTFMLITCSLFHVSGYRAGLAAARREFNEKWPNEMNDWRGLLHTNYITNVIIFTYEHP